MQKTRFGAEFKILRRKNMRSDIVSEAISKYGSCIEKNSFVSFTQALRAAPDSCAERLMKMHPKSKLLTFLLSLVGGVLALDRFYIGERRSAISKLIMNVVSIVLFAIPFVIYGATGTMGIWGFFLYIGAILGSVSAIFYLGDVFTLRKKVKEVNYKLLAGFLHDAATQEKDAIAAKAKEELEAAKAEAIESVAEAPAEA